MDQAPLSTSRIGYTKSGLKWVTIRKADGGISITFVAEGDGYGWTTGGIPLAEAKAMLTLYVVHLHEEGSLPAEVTEALGMLSRKEMENTVEGLEDAVKAAEVLEAP